MTRKPLTVYKASAGSGKTFTLATEYIRLLVENPQSYRTILAVTFTNKATEEMKTRSLSQLYGIWKQLPDSNRYLKAIEEKTGLPPETISERAGEGLTNLDSSKTSILTKSIPDLLVDIFPKEKYKIKGSIGQGRITKCPWIAIMNKNVTTSTQEGVYLVFLLAYCLLVF